jgi:hypothetical protein
MTLTPVWYPVLFLTGLTAGFVDAIAGGGGLITVPVLLATGISPQDALGTNKLQSSCGTALATLHYARRGLLQDTKMLAMGIAATAVGAAAGTFSVSHVKSDFLRPAIPVLLVLIALYTWFRPALGRESRPARLSPALFSCLFGLVLGFYDGFFGPGTGAFWAVACVTLLGLDLLSATAHTKMMNLTSNLVSLAVFIRAGHAQWGIGAVMAAGQFVGGHLGASVAVRGGVKFIRPLFLSVVLLLAARLLWQSLH